MNLRTLRKSEHSHCTSQEPHVEESFGFRCRRKTIENYSWENPRSQLGTENQIPEVPPSVIQTRIIEVEGKERYLNTNVTNHTAQQEI